MIDSIPRPVLSADEYRECRMIAMQIMLMLPHQDHGKCLVIRDMCEDELRRWLNDERLPRHHLLKERLESADILRFRPTGAD